MSDPMPVVEEAAREALEYGLLSEDEMDEAIRNVFRTKLKQVCLRYSTKSDMTELQKKIYAATRHRKICLELNQKNQLFLLQK